MLNNIFNNSQLIVGITYTKYNSSLSSYIRFLAKHNNFKHKNITRIEKILVNNKLVSGLLKGPVHIFYSENISNIKFLSDIKNLNDINIIFIAYNKFIIMAKDIIFDKTVSEYKAQPILSINSILSNVSVSAINQKLIYLIYAYSKSIIKGGSNS